jgi:hypothetical protein
VKINLSPRGVLKKPILCGSLKWSIEIVTLVCFNQKPISKTVQFVGSKLYSIHPRSMGFGNTPVGTIHHF